MVSSPCQRDIRECAITERYVSHINFKWAGKFFSTYPNEAGKIIDSPLFGGKNEEKFWRLRLYPGGDKKESAGFVSIDLQYQSSRNVTVDFEITVVDSDMSVHTSNSTPSEKQQNSPGGQYIEFGIDSKMWGYDKFIAREKLLENSKNLLPDDTLTVVCEMKVFSDPYERQSDLTSHKCPSVNFLENLFDAKKFTDVTFILKEKKIQAHKCVMASCSVVFDAMFSNEMKEKETNEVKIDDVEERVFTEMLRFIYTGQVENSNVIAADLLSVADKYDLKHLKDFAQLEMMKNFSVETAAKFLILADLHRSELLKEETIKYISRNSAAVIKTEGWKQLITTYLHLLVEIFEYQNL